MKYRCIPCGSDFEVEDGAKVRCPKCLGIHDLEPVRGDRSGSGGGSKTNWIAPVVILVVLGALAAVYFTLSKKQQDQTEQQSKSEDLPSALEDLGISKTAGKNPIEASKEIEEFASTAVDGKSGPDGIKAIFDSVVDMKGKGLWRPSSQREARPEEPLTAAGLYERLQQKEKGAYEALSYELACLLLASAKSQKLEAKMVEVWSFKDEKRPADPSGKLGRYAVLFGDEKGGQVFDPYAGRAALSDHVDFRVLSDAEAAAPFYGLSSLSLVARHENSEALKKNEIAVKLDPDNPYFRVGRGLIFAASAAPNEALAEFEKAAKQRQDPVFRANLAEVLLLMDPSGKRAEAEIHAALEAMPDFARAHALLAMVHLLQREPEQAEQELAISQRLDPDSPVTAMFWAQLLASQARNEEAITKAKESVRLSGDSVSSLLGLAGILRITARFDEMRETLDRLLDKDDSAGMRQQIKDLFNYDPSKDESSRSATAEGEGDRADSLELKLRDEGSPDGQGLGLGKSPTEGLNLDKGLGSGLGQTKKPTLGGEGLELDLNLKNN